MTPRLRLFGIATVLLGFASVLPATVGAQPPVYLTQWGSFGGGDGQFDGPTGVATDAAGDVYVVDHNNHRMQKFTGMGTYLTKWGSPLYEAFYPTGVATDAAGNVYVVDSNNHRIQKFSGTGTYLTHWGSQGSGDGQFYYPIGVATDAAGNVYVADSDNNRIQKFTDTGTYLTQWGSQGSGDGQLSFPTYVATDAAGNVYVSDFNNNRIQKFTGAGAYLTQWGSPGSGEGQFDSPIGVATDAAGNVYVVDSNNNRIQKFTGNGTYLAQWGSQGSGDGQFALPQAVATDAAGNIYVADYYNYRIQKFGPGPTSIAMAFDFSPSTLNLKSRGLWVTGFLEPASPFAAGDIDISSIRLNGTVPVGPAAPTALGDHNGNGVPDLMVKFNRTAVELTVSGGDSVPVIVTGALGSDSFLGTDYIRVCRAAASTLRVDSQLGASSATQVRETFSIDDQVDVGDRGAQFALLGITPNPAEHELRVSFSLRDPRAATLALFDVSGRQLAARRVDGMGAGWHTVTLAGQSNLPAGLYVIRLTQGQRSLTTRAAVVR